MTSRVTPWVMEAHGPGIDQQGEVGMAVDIDEAGGHREALGVEDGRVPRIGEVSDMGDAAARDGDVGPERRRTRAVDDGPAPDDEVGRRHGAAPAPFPWRRRRSVASRSTRKRSSRFRSMITP